MAEQRGLGPDLGDVGQAVAADRDGHRQLYVDIGLSIHHIALLIGLGDMATRNRLTQASVPLRPSRGRCPWNRRRYPGAEDDDRARTASQ